MLRIFDSGNENVNEIQRRISAMNMDLVVRQEGPGGEWISWAHFCSSRFCTLLASLRPPIRSILTNICNTPSPILCERIYFHLAHAAVWLHGCISTSVAIYAAMNVFVCVRVHSFSAVVHTAVLISMIDEAKRNTHTHTNEVWLQRNCTRKTVHRRYINGETNVCAVNNNACSGC